MLLSFNNWYYFFRNNLFKAKICLLFTLQLVLASSFLMPLLHVFEILLNVELGWNLEITYCICYYVNTNHFLVFWIPLSYSSVFICCNSNKSFFSKWIFSCQSSSFQIWNASQIYLSEDVMNLIQINENQYSLSLYLYKIASST